MSDGLERGPHDFCMHTDCGAALNDRDSCWGSCIECRQKGLERIKDTLSKIRAKLETGEPLKGKPRE